MGASQSDIWTPYRTDTRIPFTQLCQCISQFHLQSSGLLWVVTVWHVHSPRPVSPLVSYLVAPGWNLLLQVSPGTTQHYTNYITLRYIYNCNCNYNCNCHYIALRYTALITIHYNYNYTTSHYTRLDYTIPHYSTERYSTLQYTTRYYTNYTTPQLHLQLQLQLHYTNYITLELQLTTKTPLHYTTTATTTALHHTTSNSCGEVTTVTIAATPENTTPTTFPSISGFALPSVIHNNQPLL